jgi:adenosylcobinamide amidohydrolase
LHTEIGEAVGAAVYSAVAKGVIDWMAEQDTA